MTQITLTEREPRCDIEAQFRALIDPDHPKRAVWISLGTPIHVLAQFAVADGVYRLDTHWGTFFGSEHACGRLEDEPTEEMLSKLLDYTEPKSWILLAPALWYPVVQARDDKDCVVWEQVSSWERLTQAIERARLYGTLEIMTIGETHRRRLRLIAKEERDAKGFQGRRGRGQA